MRLIRLAGALLLAFTAVHPAAAADGNRLTYLDGNDPYYVSRTFPKLITPQWVGEDGVEAVVILAIDDMRDPEKYETYLRPILNRLKQIDGRAPVSIMTCQVDPKTPRLQQWLKEGLSLETHTIDHPCPMMRDGSLAKAASTYERCVDLMSEVPNSHPVAFRVPCCDSLNTPSPRFYAEVFNKTTAKGNFLTIDSSVFNVFTSNDPDLPRDLVIDPDGRDKFRKYLPADRTFVNTIENYPYPYVLGRLCWEFPCVTPSDWSAQHHHNAVAHPVTLRDLKAALDAVVLKQGVYDLVFHPYGWIRPEQVVDLIDHAVAKHGKKVKFLTFREAQERLNKNLLGGQPLRDANGQDNGVRLLDVNNDGYLDVVIGNPDLRQTRLWSPKERRWILSDFPTPLVSRHSVKGTPITNETGAHFGILRADGQATMLPNQEQYAGGWHFDTTGWIRDEELGRGIVLTRPPASRSSLQLLHRGIQFRDLDGDGVCELLIADPYQHAVLAWSWQAKSWKSLPFRVPKEVYLLPESDSGARFIDLDGDGHDDIIFSDVTGFGVYLFTSMETGWDRKVIAGKHGDPGALPLISRHGFNNGMWVHSRHLWFSNEDTNLLKDHVDRRSFDDLLKDVEPQAKSLEASLRSIQMRPGFEVELVAAEPLVQSPIAFAWGPDGKLWVVEMGDYPLGVDGKGKPGGRIKFLESTKGDGKYDKATIFLDNLPFPTGVMPWRKGVLVTCAPEIFYAEDTKGTGKADLRIPLYTGFHEGNQQHRVNSLVWGLDNWIYCANGDSGGRVRSVKTGAEIDMRGRDLRIRPDDGGLDAQSGQTQYGRSRDDWGNWFGNNNSNPMFHYALADHYLRRNPHVAYPDPRVHVSVTPGAARVYPISRTLPRFNDPAAANHFTSACSAIVYRDELFGPHFASNTFVSEPVHNLIHREVMTAQGVTFTSHRAADETQSEFFASSDNWCRPTMIQTGPDGALWVADMYRQVIEHPEWIPPDWQKRLDLRAGHDKGRIYRIYPVGQRPRAIPRLDKLDAAGLVAALDSPSGWQRDMAQQLLIQRNDRTAVPLLEKLASNSQRPLARVHAFCTLDGLRALTPTVLLRGLADAHPGVRRQAIRLCEPFLKDAAEKEASTALGAALVRMSEDTDSPVRMQLAYSLGEWNDPRAGKTLGALALKEAGDRYLTAAVMSSLNSGNLDGVMLAVLGSAGKAPPELLENLLRVASALGKTRALATMFTAIGTPAEGKFAPWQFAALAGLLDALDARGQSLRQLGEQGDELKAGLGKVDKLFVAARALVADAQAPRPERLQAVRLLGRGPGDRDGDLAKLGELLVPQVGADLQAAAVATLGRLRDPRVPEILVRGWKGYGPGLRSQLLDVLLARPEWQTGLLDAIERKQVLPAEIDAARRQRLLTLTNVSRRERAARLFAGAVDADREKVVRAYAAVLTLKGEPTHGREIFGKTCATCHQLAGLGQQVGPDLASVGDKSPASMLVAILDPNRSVEARYVSYQATTKNGQTFAGVLAAETSTTITLIGSDGKQQVLLRQDLEEFTSSGKSVMPEGLEKDLKPQDVADVIAFVRSAGPAPQRKTFEGNKPEVVRAAGDGSLRLAAASAEIYGSTLVLEPQYGNLGFWSSDDDRAAWTVDVPRAGKYEVWLEWACDDGSAGNRYVLEAGLDSLTGSVDSTGSWDVYRSGKVGELPLTAGQQRIVVRSVGKIKGALIDLKSIKLVPAGAK